MNFKKMHASLVNFVELIFFIGVKSYVVSSTILAAICHGIRS